MESIIDLWTTLWAIIKGCTIGFAELRWDKAEGKGFPRTWIERSAGVALGHLGFGFGIAVVTIAAGMGAVYVTMQFPGWISRRIRRSR